MAPSARAASICFDFDFFRFNGKGVPPSVVPAPEHANFIRSRYSIPEQLVNVATERLQGWARWQGLSVSPKRPFPSIQAAELDQRSLARTS